MNCCVGHRCSSDLTWLWLWHRPAAAAPILPLVWELPFSADGALKRKHTHTHSTTLKFHDRFLDFPTFRVQIGGQLETVFLLSGNDLAIHLYKEVRQGEVW